MAASQESHYLEFVKHWWKPRAKILIGITPSYKFGLPVDRSWCGPLERSQGVLDVRVLLISLLGIQIL